jgi:ubiquinone/menaquinone biosynthesis C-methylase UbiE
MNSVNEGNVVMQPTYWRRIDHIIGPATAEEFERIDQKDTREVLESFILRKSDTDTRLIDVGCNTGVEGYRLFQAGYQGGYVGVDSNAKALVYSMVNLSGRPASVTLADATALPFPDRSFDIALNKDVIEHAPHYRDILAELGRVARRYVVLSMFIQAHDLPDEIHREPEGYYHNRYNRAGIYRLMQEAGFGEPEIIYTAPQPRHRGFRDEVLVFERCAVPVPEAATA